MKKTPEKKEKVIMKNESQPKTINHKELDLLTAIELIVEMSAGSNLGDSLFVAAEESIVYVSKKLHVTPMQAILFSVFVDKSDDPHIEYSDLAEHFSCRPVRIIRYAKDIDVLLKKRLLWGNGEPNGSIGYSVPNRVLEALKQNKAYKPKKQSNLNIEDFFIALSELFEQKMNNSFTYTMFVEEVNLLLLQNKHLLFVRKLENFKISGDDIKILLIFFCIQFVEEADDHIQPWDYKDLLENKIREQMISRGLSDGSNKLFSFNLVEYSNVGGFTDRNSFKLTDFAKKELLSELNIVVAPEVVDKQLIETSNLPKKELFYNEEEKKSVEKLAQLLHPDQFKEVCERMSKRGMRKGFACLFYGAPGTGKTETVYQLAKQTGRNILQVNYSQLKSSWVGESEKNVKALFDKYRRLVATSEVAPILLFNEADAIISRRQADVQRAVDKMENSIQNIILQEMENLEGIMIATTNFTQNMDKAFERRFIYKILFRKPNLEAMCSIWHSMIPTLSESDVRVLASKYEFSGGQIENIARKIAVDEIINGDNISLETLRSYCDGELFDRQKRLPRIGYLANQTE